MAKRRETVEAKGYECHFPRAQLIWEQLHWLEPGKPRAEIYVTVSG